MKWLENEARWSAVVDETVWRTMEKPIRMAAENGAGAAQQRM